MYVENKLEEYDDLVECYSTLCTKQPTGNSNAKPNECWEMVEAQFREEMKKNGLHIREMRKGIEGTC
jgi:hypothetical protein